MSAQTDMNSMEINTRLTAADARAKSGSWSERMKERWESQGMTPLNGTPLNDGGRDAIGLARAITLPDGQVWTSGNGQDFWRDGPISGLIQHWEKDTRDHEGKLIDGLVHRRARGELTGNFQDTFDKNGPPKEWVAMRYDFEVEELIKLAGSNEKEAIRNAMYELTQTLHNTLHNGPMGGQRMIVASPVHFDTKKPHVDFYVHQFEFDHAKNHVLGQTDYGKSSQLKSELLRIRESVLDRHGVDFYAIKLNGQYVDLPWELEKTIEDRLAERREPVPEGFEVIEQPDTPEDNIGAPEAVQAAQQPTQLPPALFRRPIASPELTQVQQYRKNAAKEKEEARRNLEAAEAREQFAAHVESAFIAAEEAKAERDTAIQLAEEMKAKIAASENELAEVVAARAKTLADLEEHIAKLDESLKREAVLSTNFDKALEIQAKTASELAEVKLDVEGLEADLKAAQDDYKDEKKLREETENLNAALKSDLEKRTAEIAKIADDAAKKLDETVKTFANERSSMQAQIDALKAQLEASTANAKMLEDNFSQFKENAANAAQNALREPAGDSGMSVLSTSVKARQKPNFAENVLVKSGWFSTTLKTPTATLIGNNHGIKSDSTIDDLTASTMIEYAKSKGWQHIKPTGSDLEISLLVKHAEAAGITIEGWTNKPTPKASVVPADIKSEPVAPAAEAPKTDNRKWYEKTGSAHLLDAEDKKAAEKAFENWRKAGGDKVDAITFEQFVRGANNDWKAKQNPENDDPNNDGPQRPQGKVTVKKPKR